MSTVGSSSATYDGSGNPTGLTNGGAQNFDAAGELCWSASTAPTPTPADPDPRCSATAPSGSTTYAYDSMGDRTGTTTSSSSSSYLYNQTGELVDESPAGTSGYTTVTPTRVCDTRSGNPSGLSGTYNQCNNSTLGAGGTVAVQLSETGGPIPATGVSAIVANVTATNNSGSGSSYVTVYPTGTTAPATSNLNVSAGATVNNQVTVGVGTNGSGAPSITIYNYNDSVDVQVDVEGYYTTGSGGSGYVPVTPTRICDTRSGNPSGLSSPNNQCNGGSGNPGSPISAGGTLTVEAAGSLSSGYLQAIGATAVVADVTAISPSSSTYLTSYKQGASRPSTYSLNAPSGTTVDKEMTIALNTSNGEFVLYNSAGTVNVTVDVEGFFIGGSGNLYAPVSPSLRVCDTRTGNPSGLSSPYNQCNGDTIAAAGTLTVQVAGLAGVPSTAASIVVSITSLNETATGRLVAYQAGTSLPSVSTLNFTSGAKVNNEATVAVGTNGDIDIYNSAGTTDVLVDVLGYYGSNYTYNGDGLRMTKTINGTVSTFTYDTTQTNPLVLKDGANAYVYGPSGEPVEQVSTSGTPLYFVSDHLGSTRSLTNSSGTVVAQYAYGPLGNIATKTGSASTPIGFAGAYTDSETGFLYLLHRYYDPATGQFISVDPLVAQTEQPYIYAGDDPVNSVDPSGEDVPNLGFIQGAVFPVGFFYSHGVSMGEVPGCKPWSTCGQWSGPQSSGTIYNLVKSVIVKHFPSPWGRLAGDQLESVNSRMTTATYVVTNTFFWAEQFAYDLLLNFDLFFYTQTVEVYFGYQFNLNVLFTTTTTMLNLGGASFYGKGSFGTALLWTGEVVEVR